MEDNAMRTATDMQIDDKVGVVEMKDNKDGRQVQRWRRVVEMRDNRDSGDGYTLLWRQC